MPLDTPIGEPRVDFMRAREMSPETARAIDEAFEFKTWSAAEIERGARIRTALADAVKAIIANAPPCPTRTIAIRKCMEARMDANSAITHNGRY
jgi:hypothetical protein